MLVLRCLRHQEQHGQRSSVELVILFLVVIWLALVYWTFADARRRIADPLLVGCATAASLFPFVGTIVYMIVRPPEYLDDVRERELEIQAAEARLAELGLPALPVLRLRGREGLPALPELHAQAQGPVRHLRAAARPDVEDLPVLRGRGRRCRAAAAARPPTPRRHVRAAGRRARPREHERARDPVAEPAPAERGGPSAQLRTRRRPELRPRQGRAAHPWSARSSSSSPTPSHATSPARSSPASSARGCSSPR